MQLASGYAGISPSARVLPPPQAGRQRTTSCTCVSEQLMLPSSFFTDTNLS